MRYPEVTEKIIAAALKVHSAIGPGVLESRVSDLHDPRTEGNGLEGFKRTRPTGGLQRLAS